MNKNILLLAFSFFLLIGDTHAMQENQDDAHNDQHLAQVQQPDERRERALNRTQMVPQPQTQEQFALENVAFPQIHITNNMANVERINDTGKAIVEAIVNEKAKNLKAWQKEKIEHCALTGNFEAYSFLSKFWEFVGSVSYPLANMAQLVNSVLPLLSFGLEGEPFETRWKIAISISGVLALFLDKVSVFAYDTSNKETIIYDILQLIKARQDEIDNIDPLPLMNDQEAEA